jgi:glyoxylase-like metal-dependent hydrolase (beta-lactamase superfamily II)
MSHQADEILRIETPLPSRPRSVNAFLVPLDAGGMMLVDGGIDSDDAWAALSRAIAGAGGWSAIRLHVVTHMHLDHFGLAHRVRAASSAPLAMGELDAERAAHAASDPAEERDFRDRLLRENGAPEADVEAVRRAIADPRASVKFVEPEIILSTSDSAIPDALEWRSIWTPGHTAGHISLFRSRDRSLIAGDAVIPRVSPTIGVNRQREDPIGDYLRTLDRLESLTPTRTFGGHGEPMEGIARATELRRESIAESERVLALLGSTPATAWEIALRRYEGRDLPLMLKLLAFRETLAHLQRLDARGDAVRLVDGGESRFTAVG